MADDAPEDDDTMQRHGLPVHKNNPRIYSKNSPNARAAATVSKAGKRKRVRNAFLQWLVTWPSGSDRNEALARCVWFDELTNEERADCIALSPAYLRENARPPAPDVFLRGRLWKVLPAARRVRTVNPEHAPYGGKLWMAGFLWSLLQPPSGRIHVTIFDRQSVRAGKETEAVMQCRKLMEGGWPQAVGMIKAFDERRKSYCDGALMLATDDFRQVKWGDDVFSAWSRLHARLCWPFPHREPLDGFVWLPPVANPAAGDLDLQVEAALAAFETRVKEVLNG